MSAFTEVQRLIMATLEEAGEEHVSALVNTVLIGRGRSAEVIAMRVALEDLLRSGLISVARTQDESTLEWITLADHEAAEALQDIEFCLSWSDSKNIWITAKDKPRLEVLLTAAGERAARQVLSQYGRPQPESKIKIS